MRFLFLLLHRLFSTSDPDPAPDVPDSFPRTEAQAQRRRYGPHRERWKPWACAYTVHSTTTHQCRRKPGHGPGGLYCKMHSQRLERLRIWLER